MARQLFRDENGSSFKFFIQKDLEQQLQNDLCQSITALGGRIETKVPRTGFILIQPGSAEAERLRTCWLTSERPERYFVPYTYVEACRTQGTLLRQIFAVDTQPIKMHIHSSIMNVNVRMTISQRIAHGGGDPTATLQDATVIIADPETEVFQHLVKTYQSVSNKYIESWLWVKKCVDHGQLIFTPLIYKNPGGRRAGEERTQFTEQDEENLCTWIATKIPYKSTGGRTGNKLYQQLCEQTFDPNYSWVTRHTWQSWRERYKKNANRLDPLIDRIVAIKNIQVGGKGQYGFVRANEKAKRPRKKRDDSDGQENADGHLGGNVQFSGDSMMPHMNGVPPSMGMPMPIVSMPPPHGMHFPPPPPPPGYPGPSSMEVLGHAPAPLHGILRAEEEAEEDEGEWAIRIGNAPVPSWAKRKGLADGDESPNEGPNKRARRDSEASPSSQSTSGPLHVVDQAIEDIAHEFRFTSDEVREYYDKHGDVHRTRARFMEMRRVISLLPDEP